MNETQPAEDRKYTVKPGGADPYATRLVAELKHDRGLLACRYDGSGRYVFAGGQDYLIHRWDLTGFDKEVDVQPDADDAKKNPQNKKAGPPALAAPSAKFSGHESWVRAMALFPDGARLVTGDYVGRVIVWPATDEAPQPKWSLAAHTGSVRAVAASPAGDRIATAGNDHVVRVWKLDGTAQPQLELAGHDCHVYNVAFHPDGQSLVSADLKGRVKHWDAASGKLVRELDADLLYTYSVKYTVHVGGVRGMAFNADGSQLACAGATGEKGIAHSGHARVLLFDWDSGELALELKQPKEEIATAWGVRFHPDGFLVASGGSRTGGYLWFWTADDAVAFHMLKFQQRAPGFDLDLAPDNPQRLAVANHDGAVRIYEMAAEPEPAEKS